MYRKYLTMKLRIKAIKFTVMKIFAFANFASLAEVLSPFRINKIPNEVKMPADSRAPKKDCNCIVDTA